MKLTKRQVTILLTLGACASMTAGCFVSIHVILALIGALSVMLVTRAMSSVMDRLTAFIVTMFLVFPILQNGGNLVLVVMVLAGMEIAYGVRVFFTPLVCEWLEGKNMLDKT